MRERHQFMSFTKVALITDFIEDHQAEMRSPSTLQTFSIALTLIYKYLIQFGSLTMKLIWTIVRFQFPCIATLLQTL